VSETRKLAAIFIADVVGHARSPPPTRIVRSCGCAAISSTRPAIFIMAGS
jgi:hypothetical protein